MREETNPNKELNDLKIQLARLAYDIFSITLERSGKAPELNYHELPQDYKHAWTEGVWAAVEAGKDKNTKIAETVTLKQQDNGYLLYAGCREIKKSHANLFTYSKFPDEIKGMYKDLALKLYQKIDAEEEV